MCNISYLQDNDKFKIDLKTKDCTMTGLANIVEDNVHVLHMDIEPINDKTNQVLAQLDGNTQEFKFISAQNVSKFCKKHTHFFTVFK